MGSRGDLAAELRRLLESLHPDLRPFLRPSLLGKVVAVDDDNYRVDVVVGADEEAGEQGLALPEIPVSSIFAQDGYGIWALPEVDAEVTVSFHDGDVTRPYVEAPVFFNNRAPGGFTTGTIAIRGKQGQKFELKPGNNEIVLSAGSVKIITTDKRQEKVVGDEVRTVVGDQKVRVAGHQQTTAASWAVDAEGEASLEAATLSETTRGDLRQQVGGGLKQTVGGCISQQVAGGVTTAVTFSRKEVVGGAYQILVAATPGVAPPPPSPAYSVLVNLGSLALDSMGGQVDIGANPLTPPLFVNIGSPMSGPVQLGGLGATGQPAPCGLPLQIILNTILTVLKTVPLGIGNLGAPIAPNPAVSAALAAADAAMAQLLSGKVFIAAV
ncbi:MAG: phage baseplate assembly protein V [Pseudomonadota bacterium]